MRPHLTLLLIFSITLPTHSQPRTNTLKTYAQPSHTTLVSQSPENPQVQTYSNTPDTPKPPKPDQKTVTNLSPTTNQPPIIVDPNTPSGDPEGYIPKTFEDMPVNYQPPEPPQIYKPSEPPCMSGWVLRVFHQKTSAPHQLCVAKIKHCDQYNAMVSLKVFF